MKKIMYFIIATTVAFICLGVILAASYIWTSKNHLANSEDASSSACAFFSDLDQQLLDRRVIMLSGKITSCTSRHVVASLLVLDSNEPGVPIWMIIDSPGGDRSAWQSIVQTMTLMESKVNVLATGRVVSSGAYILANATGRRIAHKDSTIGVHLNFKKSRGQYSDEQNAYENIISYWKGFSLPENFLPSSSDKRFNKTFYLNAQEALEFSIIDEIFSGAEDAKNNLELFHYRNE